MMRRSDWALVILVAFVAGFVAFATTNSLTSSDGQRKPTEKVDTATKIVETVDKPSDLVYSEENKTQPPINPTVVVVTGSGDNSTPTETDNAPTNDATPVENSTETNPSEETSPLPEIEQTGE